MKLDKLRLFYHHLKTDLDAEVTEASLYYYFENKWHELDSELSCDSVKVYLNRAKSEPIAYHATNNLDAWFYFSPSDCIVRLVFPKSPQKATRTRYRNRLEKFEENATNAYKVSHNPLTHLLAKDAFREELTKAISDVASHDTHSDETQENGIARALVVMALDIDHFKQINDTWGHLYGDQVLKTFGFRLEKCAETIRSQGVGKPDIFLGHPSGEEFLILITANALRDQFVEWANEFRKKISDEVLPTEKEWEWLSNSDNISVLSPPPLQDRGTSVSIGVAIYKIVSSSDSVSTLISGLLDRADTALYRAKAAGRNQVIFYDEILSSCGRVIEQDKNNHVVALDIGANVGVSVGQEFKVFSPTFTGKTKFLVNDGRTTRTLGLYPRVEAARIVVFNTQPEISFAFIAGETNSEILLEEGSHLEAIPAGSIGHLLSSTSKYFPASPNTRERSSSIDPQEYVKKTATENNGPFAIVVRFTNEAEYLRKYGTVALNMALAQLYRDAQLKFHTAVVIEVLDRGSICVVGNKTSYVESLVADFVEAMAAELPPELGVFAGVFCEADREASKEDGHSMLDSCNAVEFARFAATDAGRSPTARLRHFSYNVAIKVLQALRDSRSFETAYADFERLCNLGVESARLFNLGGLIAGSLGLRQQALDHYASAILKDPSTLIYKSNFAAAAYAANEAEPALKILNPLPLSDIDQLIKTHPYGYVTYARLLARAKLTDSDFYDESRFIHVAKNALAITEYDNMPESEIIKVALDVVNGKQS